MLKEYSSTAFSLPCVAHAPSRYWPAAAAIPAQGCSAQLSSTHPISALLTTSLPPAPSH